MLHALFLSPLPVTGSKIDLFNLICCSALNVVPHMQLILHVLPFHFHSSLLYCHFVCTLVTIYCFAVLFFSSFFFFACHPNLHPSLPPVDVWSVGCIVAEMIRGSVLFPGTDRILPPSLVYRLVVTSFWVKGLHIIQRLPVSVIIFSATLSSLCWTNLLKKKMGSRIAQVYSLLSTDATISKSQDLQSTSIKQGFYF